MITALHKEISKYVRQEGLPRQLLLTPPMLTELIGVGTPSIRYLVLFKRKKDHEALYMPDIHA